MVPARFSAPITVSLLPTLLSAYAARDTRDVYSPVNLLALETCGSRGGSCRLRKDLEAWAVHHLFVKPRVGVENGR